MEKTQKLWRLLPNHKLCLSLSKERVVCFETPLSLPNLTLLIPYYNSHSLFWGVSNVNNSYQGIKCVLVQLLCVKWTIIAHRVMLYDLYDNFLNGHLADTIFLSSCNNADEACIVMSPISWGHTVTTTTLVLVGGWNEMHTLWSRLFFEGGGGGDSHVARNNL